MSERALVASRAGTVRPWLEPAVAALGHEVVGTLVVDAPEHGEYHLPPGLVERLADRIEATDSGYLAIDGHVHPGQAADLLAALPPVVLRDRRGVAYERLAAGGNGAAATLLERQERRTERRQAANQSREAATEGPTGTAGRVEELERRCQRLDERLAERQAAAREAVETGYAVVDARVVLLGPPTAPTTPLWAELTGAEPRDGGPLAPAEPVTATARIGPHEVAVTDTPGAVEELPEWFAGSVPGTVAALERADVVVLVGSAGDAPALAALDEAVAGRSDAARLPALPAGSAPENGWSLEPVDAGEPEAVRSRLAGLLETATLAVRLPYDDEAHALVSWLHDRTAVESVAYGDDIALTVTAPAGAAAELRRRVEAVGGEVATPADG
jgi:50S ribosomal subunit-associated GTPase HflX